MTPDEAGPRITTTAAPAVVTSPAVVVGANADGLGIARSLGAGGVPVILVDLGDKPAMHSRHAAGAFVAEALSGPPLIQGLRTLRARLPHRPVLFLTTDLQVDTVAQHYEEITTAFHLRLPQPATMTELLHKWGFQRLAEQHAFPVPRAISVRDERDFAKFAELQFPAVVKPGTKELFFSNRAPRAQRVASREQAETLCRAVLPQARDLIVQEWVEGDDSDIYFCLQYRGENGATISSFTGRKLRCWPPETGSTATCTAAPDVAALLEPLTKAFFDQAGVVGMCSMEFKRDRRTGAFRMIEPTVCRTDWQEEVATLNGVNIPLAAYCYELGLPLPPARRPAQPLIWSYPPSYWRSVLVSKSFRDARPPGARVASACWRADDPLPLAFFYLEWLQRGLCGARWREFLLARAPRLLPL